MVQKTLDYSSHAQSALFTADFHDGPNYTAYSQGFASELPATWQINDAYLEGQHRQRRTSEYHRHNQLWRRIVELP